MHISCEFYACNLNQSNDSWDMLLILTVWRTFYPAVCSTAELLHNLQNTSAVDYAYKLSIYTHVACSKK